MTLSEDFGLNGRGVFYEKAGCLRDVIQNHLFQIVALLAMEPPAYGAAPCTGKGGGVPGHAAADHRHVVRGPMPGTARNRMWRGTLTWRCCAVRLFIDSWRWAGVPCNLRSGKRLAETAAEVLVQLKPPPQRLFADSAPATGRADYPRFRLSPNSAVALAARVKRVGHEFVGDQRELSSSIISRERRRRTSGS